MERLITILVLAAASAASAQAASQKLIVRAVAHSTAQSQAGDRAQFKTTPLVSKVIHRQKSNGSSCTLKLTTGLK
jgi:hypothetical protein